MPGESYTVQRKDTVYSVAQKYGVRMNDIIALNKLKSPYTLKTGQVITLPAKDGAIAPTPEAAPLDYIDKGYMRPTAPVSTSSTGLAGAQDVSAMPLEPLSTSAPPPSTPTSLTTPQVNAKPPASPFASPTSESAPAALPPPNDPVSGETAPPLPPPSETGATSIAPPPSTPEASPTSPSTAVSGDMPSFVWPVRGTIISTFGPKDKGRDNDGINIGAPKGSPVKAAEGGIVVHASNDMKGFGNLVLIRHEGGWVTAYAHLDRLTVAKDDIVAKGDMIGNVGATGGVSSPQLHFEARRGGVPVDPELVMKE